MKSEGLELCPGCRLHRIDRIGKGPPHTGGEGSAAEEKGNAIWSNRVGSPPGYPPSGCTPGDVRVALRCRVMA